jgi:murein endopeptidase
VSARQTVRGGIAREQHAVLFGGARRRRLLTLIAMVSLVAAVAAALVVVRPVGARTAPPSAAIGPAPAPPTDDGQGIDEVVYPVIAWRNSRAVGETNNGTLKRGVQLPSEGPDWFTWDPVLNQSPNRGWRRWGTDALLRTVIHVLREYRVADPEAPRVGIMDLSRENGGFFGREFGGLGHASHQNGLDVDVMYPRRDEHERRPFRVAQVDRERAQDLVDRFVRAGAEKIFVGPNLGLTGPKAVVIPLVYHDDHLHLRILKPPA